MSTATAATNPTASSLRDLTAEGAELAEHAETSLAVRDRVRFAPQMIAGRDLHWWLRDYGLNLDPHAALSSSVDPFIPPVLWKGTIAQFSTVPRLLSGFWLAMWSSGLILAGLFFHRRAYKPLVDHAATPGQASDSVGA